MAGQVYNSVRRQENLLLEAVTGSGKTMAVLFPALKAQAAMNSFSFDEQKSRCRRDIECGQTIDRTVSTAASRPHHSERKTCPMAEMTCDAGVVLTQPVITPPAEGPTELEQIPLLTDKPLRIRQAHALAPLN